MQIDVINKEGKSTGRSVELPDGIFGAEPNDHLIYLAVKQFRAAQRYGNHKVKGRAEVKGSSKKLHRQKGTGGSRKGNLRNPLYKGGGAVHGPEPHLYTFKMNRKEKDMAKVSAFAHKAKDNKIKVVDSLEWEAPKTKEGVALLNNLELSDKRVLFVVDGFQDNFYLSVRNLPKMQVCDLIDVNTHDIVKADTLVFTEAAAKEFTEDTSEEAANEAAAE
jgi:large subunit ribosomal protein L4